MERRARVIASLAPFAPLAALAAAVAIVHGRDATFRFTSLDDLTLVVDDQPFLTSPDAPLRAFGRAYFHIVDAAHAYYRPVVTASYALDARAFGAAPFGYHVTNVLLHLVATWLVHALLVRADMKRSTALLGAAVFAVHPALVQTVAWLPGRNDSLLAVFALGAVLAHAHARALSRAAGLARAVHLVCFALAMFTKETAIVVPLLCIAWTQLVERDATRDRTHARAATAERVLDGATWLGWALVIAGFAFARHRVLSDASIASIASGASSTPSAIDWSAPAHHIAMLVTSLGKIVLPVSLAPIATFDDTPLWPGAVALLALTALVVHASRGGAARMHVVGFGALSYVLALAPALFAPGSLALENRLYLPAVGVVVMLAEIADKARADRRVMLAIGSVVAIALAAMSIGHASAFRDPLSFAKAAVAGAPRSSLAHFTLGQARQLRGDLDAAIVEYARALAIDPSEPIVHNNLAVIYMQRREWARAETELEAELRVNPGYATAEDNLAIVRRRLGKE